MIAAGERTILLVEDDPVDILLVKRAHAKLGLPAPLQIVEDGDAAVDYLSGRSAYADRSAHPFPSLVLLDIKLPRRNGLEVLEWVRAQTALRRIPVVMLTSSSEPQDVNRAYDLGANSYVLKPVDAAGLAGTFARLRDYWVGLNHLPDLGVRGD